MDKIDSDKNRFYTEADEKFKKGSKQKMTLIDYLDEKKQFRMENEPSATKKHLSTDPDLLLKNAPEKNYAKELRITKRPQE